MKKTFSLLALIAIVTMAFVSCEKVNEDIYFPKVKLASILDEEGDGIVLTYSDKYISTIKYNGELVNVKYDSNDQISELVPTDPTAGKVVLSYADKKIAKITYVNEQGEVEYYMEFTRNDAGKIASVKTYSEELDKSRWESLCNNKLFSSVFSTEPIWLMLKQNNTKGQMSLLMEEFWTYNGNNVETVSVSMESEGYVSSLLKTYTYDSNPNPCFGLPYLLAEISAYSKNNAVSCVETTTISYAGTTLLSQTETTKATYTYGSNKYPTAATFTEDGQPNGAKYYTYIK